MAERHRRGDIYYIRWFILGRKAKAYEILRVSALIYIGGHTVEQTGRPIAK